MKKSVLIFGGSSGIGRATIKEFANEGYDIFATVYKGNLDEIVEYCKDKNVQINIYRVDIRDYKKLSSVINSIFKTADCLECVVYCVGVAKDEKLLMDEEIDNIKEVIDVNLTGAIYCAKECMKYFSKSKRGSIIFISSIYGVSGGAYESVYSATKGGLIALTKALSVEYANFSVRVNCVAPGFVSTPMTAKFNEEERENIKNKTPLKRLGEPEDIAKMIYFLGSDKSSLITGEVITISGGVVRY